MHSSPVILCSALFLALSFTAASALQQPVSVSLPFGLVLGTSSDQGNSFFGLPYAEPPVGQLRLAPTLSWHRDYPNKLLNATTNLYRRCMQPYPGTTLPNQAEDCLLLDIFTPVLSTGQFLPVLVWLHGGAFVSGSGVEDMYNALDLANETNTIVVTVNYRLGALGFLGLDSLVKEHGVTGNYGFMDQQMALRWIRDNIELFGGDSSKVTIFGQSAGGASVLFHLASPKSDGLFAAAIVESGPLLLQSTQSAIARGTSFAANLSCPADAYQLSCLRQLSMDAFRTNYVIDALHPLAWMPAVDGENLVHPMLAFLSGKFSKVPVVIGTTQNEGSLFASQFKVVPDITTAAAIEILRSFPALQYAPDSVFTQILQLYHFQPGMSVADTGAVLSAIITDAIFTCPTRKVSRVISSQTDTFVYRFLTPPTCMWSKTAGAFHGSEILYLFGRQQYWGCSSNSTDMAMLHVMRKYWAAQAHFLDVSKADGVPVVWPKFSIADDEPFLSMNYNFAAGKQLSREVCDFWDTVEGMSPFSSGPATSSSSSSVDHGYGHLPTGDIIGIGLGCLAVLAIVIVVAVVSQKKKWPWQKPQYAAVPTTESD